MKVYRMLEESELKKMLNGKVDELGADCEQYTHNNNHKYKKGVKYIHFFLRRKSIFEFLPKKVDGKKYYVCAFDIPVCKLLKSFGVGYYYSKKKHNNGYDALLYKVTEFSIDAKEFETSWILDIEKYENTKEFRKEKELSL